ncbi:MAG TPA: efflux RND transporter periplasmic adaptor subunit [Terriglobales bacterium]|nr:efflux RND transporter periplasmic adaptor subunit [Terriglobales bacterium]
MANSNPSFVTRHRWITATIAIVAAVVLFASLSRDPAVPVRAVTAQRGTIRSVVSTNGKVEPLQNFEAHAPVGTTVKNILVREGDQVKKGQLLVELNDAKARSTAAQAKAQVLAADADFSGIQSGGNREEVLTLESQVVKARTESDMAQRNLDALRRLREENAASPGEIKNAENQLKRADADLNLLLQKQKNRYSQPEITRVEAQKSEAQAAYTAAEDVLSQLNIRAPFNGVVYSLPVLQGAYLNPGDLVLQEADLSKVRVRAFVDEPDIGRLTPGQRIDVTWDAMPERTWKGTVSVIPTVIKLHGTRNVGETTCIVDNSDFKLLPNINVGVTIITAEHRDVLTVPREAVRQEDSKVYVYQIVNNELQRHYVQTSISNLTQVEVTAGLPENAFVALGPINSNSKPLRNGVAVKVVH